MAQLHPDTGAPAHKKAIKPPAGGRPASFELRALTARRAIAWFLSDMAEVSGYAVNTWTEGKILSMYASYRPMLTAPDPWYYAGVTALEACKIMDLFEREESDELMREMLQQMDKVVGRFNNDCSELAILLMGRLGMGSLLLHRKVPDNLLAKIMLILLGSPSAAAANMPDKNAHKQLKAALKLGSPVWWKMFKRHYKILMPNAPAEKPLLTPSILSKSEEPLLVGGVPMKPANAPKTGQMEAGALKSILTAAFRDDDPVDAMEETETQRRQREDTERGALVLDNMITPPADGAAMTRNETPTAH
jgi:hypothetical protein